MNVLQVSVRADAETAEALAAAFNEFAYGGAVIEQVVTPDAGEQLDRARPFTVRAYLLDDETAPSRRQSLERIVWAMGMLRPVGEIETSTLAEQDYANAWKKFYTVLHVGARTVIKPSWLKYEPGPGEVVIELDPGMAFGTGLHPTTRLCLAALETSVTPGCSVLDVGTGSGILSIAAARLGATRVQACDIDPIAVETAQKNVVASGLADTVSVLRGSVTPDFPPGHFDLITANIFADTIAELGPALAAHLKPGGILIASGILLERAHLVEDALAPLNMQKVRQVQEADWLVMLYSSVSPVSESSK